MVSVEADSLGLFTAIRAASGADERLDRFRSGLEVNDDDESEAIFEVGVGVEACFGSVGTGQAIFGVAKALDFLADLVLDVGTGLCSIGVDEVAAGFGP